MSNSVNPWDLFLNSTPLDNEIAFRSLFAFTNAKHVADTLHHVQEKRLKEPDLELRDIVFTGKTKEEREHPNLFFHANEHYKNIKAMESRVKFDNVMKECIRQKYFFWKTHLKAKPETKEKYDSRELVYQAVKSYKLPSQIFFTLSGFAVAYVLGLYKNPMSYRLLTVATGIFFGTMFGEFKYATQIFDAIPPLPDPEMERERQTVYNYCFSLDIRQIGIAISNEEHVNDFQHVEDPKAKKLETNKLENRK